MPPAATAESASAPSSGSRGIKASRRVSHSARAGRDRKTAVQRRSTQKKADNIYFLSRLRGSRQKSGGRSAKPGIYPAGGIVARWSTICASTDAHPTAKGVAIPSGSMRPRANVPKCSRPPPLLPFCAPCATLASMNPEYRFIIHCTGWPMATCQTLDSVLCV